MARYEFKFVVTNVDLSDEHRDQVSRAVAQAGALALADQVPANALSVEYRPGWWWRGIPPVEIFEVLQDEASRMAESGASLGG